MRSKNAKLVFFVFSAFSSSALKAISIDPSADKTNSAPAKSAAAASQAPSLDVAGVGLVAAGAAVGGVAGAVFLSNGIYIVNSSKGTNSPVTPVKGK